MQVITHLAPKWKKLRKPEYGWSLQEAGMAEFDDIIGNVMKKLEAMGIGNSLFAKDCWTFEFWRFVFVQQEVEKLAKTAIEFPPMQEGASFNLGDVKKKIERTISNRVGK
jgi:hypothetical protein